MMLEGKKALVTGGTRGIGRAIVTGLAQAGADVVTCSRHDDEAAQSLARGLKDQGGRHQVMVADVTRGEDLEQLVTRCGTELGSLDIVVHSAGVISHVPFAELEPAEWQHILDVSLTAAAMLTRTALPLLGPGSSVIFIGSRVATVGVPLRAHYTAAKAGLIGLTRSLGKELGPRGIRVNLVAPGPIETDAPVPPEVKKRYETMIPLGRLGSPAEVAAVVTFLAGDAASFLNGTTIDVDGGL